MRKVLKIAGVGVAVIVGVFVVLAVIGQFVERGPETVTVTLSTQGKSVVIETAKMPTTQSIENGQKLSLGEHTLVAENGVFTVNGEVLDFGDSDTIKISVGTDGELEIERQ